MAGALALLALIAAGSGAMPVSLTQLMTRPIDSMAWQVWLYIRLPRVVLALLVGMALALSGAGMQGLFRNPLADPVLLGVSSGAAVGVALAILFPLALPTLLALYLPLLAAFVGSLLIMLLLFSLSLSGDRSLSRLLLVGIAINAIGSAATGLLAWISNDQQLRQLSLWGMGSMGQAQWVTVAAVASLVVPCVWWLQRLASPLNLLQLGDEEAHYLGVDVRRTRRRVVILCAVLVAAAVSVSGVIAFVGLITPHLMRLLLGADHRWLLPGATLGGALLLLLADTLARTLVVPAEMPVGLLTCLIGGPWFLWLILRRQHG
ncbi:MULTISPECIES: iron ABC transporter permease [Dickeya]|uniref:Iron ABC transporter permease n=1 Tax=Dickeya fangzhongdai TaxID=1778540 RepID=A0A2K8QT59_9GAMM|nr:MULTISPECIES: iron ABC transporter permease [Dickeya]ATZ96592.1 iron ABC transporter permease [Dickeya fangzhongdai]MBO8134579.1 iron ABC transporter permease [Dickeya fangzhongdai]QOH50033.1 iron ABC transporter permease [Dickeya fangzhongdai]QOH54337.1 iron ABC transporter permease [Dickeya fangzhongdai]UGA53152.1 iron ABC transporter permease [Dickeya fangzhongdai]